jgi:glycosyltransferase involved in cell wall biosynthesis
MITLVVLHKNSLMKLRKLLSRTTFVNRILIIDDKSSNQAGLLKLAQAYKAKVVQRALSDDYAAQRNFGLSLVKRGWVLFLDPDEWLSKEAITHIMTVTKDKPLRRGFALQRWDRFRGRTLKHGEVKDMWLTRLGPAKAGTWKGKVHETWELPETGFLKGTLWHEPHASFDQMKRKARGYAKIQAREWRDEPLGLIILKLMTYPWGKFIYTFGWKRGFLDGKAGFLYSLNMTYHSMLVRWYQLRAKYNAYLADESPLIVWLRLVFLSLFGVLILGQLGRMQWDSAIRTPLIEVVIGIWLVSYSLTKPWKLKLAVPSYVWGWILLGSVMVMSVGMNWEMIRESWHVPLLYLLRFLGYGLFWWSIAHAYERKILRFPLRRGLLTVVLAWAGLGLVQYVLLPDTRFLYEFGWDDHYYRLLSTLLDPGYTALLLVLGILLLDPLPFSKYHNLLRGALWLPLLLTYARSGYVVFLGYVLGRLIYPGIHKRRVFGVWLLLSMLVVWQLPRPGGEGVRLERTVSIENRAESVVGAWDIYQQHPVWGIGFNAYPLWFSVKNDQQGVKPNHASAPSNSFMFILVTTGIIGLVAFVAWLSTLHLTGSRDFVWVLSIVAVSLHALTNNSWFYPFVLVWMGLLQPGLKDSTKQ